MTIASYLTREITKPLLAILAVLVVVVGSYLATEFLAEAASGLFSGRTAVSLLFLKIVIALEVLLPITLYLAVVLAFGRLYADSEMTALSATGVSSYLVVRTVLLLSLLLAALVAILSLYMRPWAYDQIYRLKLRARADFDISRFQPGQFYEFPPLHGVVFVEEVDHRDKRAKRVFVQTERGDRLQVACAEEARQGFDDANDGQVLRFRDGQVYELDRGRGREIFMRFERYNLPLPRTEIEPRYRLKAAPTAQLVRSEDPEEIAEVQWRFSTPVSAVLLGLLGLLLSRTAPRRGKYARVFVAILAFAIYHNTATLARHWVEQGTVGFVPGLWWVQVSLAAIVLFFLWRRGLLRWART